MGSARESEWAKAKVVLNTATRCSRETELIRGSLGPENKAIIDQLVPGDITQQPYEKAAHLLDRMAETN
uniref:Uncharacterized protein n=1 Tax=Solanum tuberosum TaxID=4113 RepID=M1DYV1_SOLTU